MHSVIDFFTIFCYETLIVTDVAADAVTVDLLRYYEDQKMVSTEAASRVVL